MGAEEKPRRKTTAQERRAERDARLAEALRANLRRRKAQAAGRAGDQDDAPQNEDER